MALSEDFRVSGEKIAKVMPRAPRSLIPITARELVEWTYAVQRAQRVPDQSLEATGRSQTGIVVDRMIEFAQLGCRVDVSSNAAAIWGETRCHEDALAVHQVVTGYDGDDRPWLTPRQRFLLIDHGRHRSIPDWQPKLFPLRCVPVMGKRGGERGIYLGSGRDLVGHEITYEGDWPSQNAAAAYRIAADSHMRLWADPANWPATRRRRSDQLTVAQHEWSPETYRRYADEVLRRARDEYSAWHDALCALRHGLDAAGPRALARYRISDLGAACEPWNAQTKVD